MTKAIKFIQNYLMYGLPFVLANMAWGSFQTDREIVTQSNFLMRALWEVLSWNLMLWFAILILFFLSLVLHVGAREMTLKRIANIKDRDEREEYITGKASKSAYVSTLAVLIFLLFISVFSLDIRRVPEDQAINGKTGTASIGLGFNIFEDAKVEKDSNGKVLFESKGLPLTKSAIILMVLIWQIAAFNLSVRKELAE